MTNDGQLPMPSEEQNCQALVTVTGDDVTNSVKVIPRLETLVSLSAVAMTTDLNNNHHHVKMVAQHKNEKYCKTVKNQISTRRFNQALFSVREGGNCQPNLSLVPQLFWLQAYSLVDEHSALPDRTVCRFRRSNCQPSAVEHFRSRQHGSGTGFLTMSRQPIRCRLFSSN